MDSDILKHRIEKQNLSKLIKTHTFKHKRVNQVGLATLKRIQDPIIEVKIFKDHYNSDEENKENFYDPAGYCIGSKLILINEELDINDSYLQEIIVHEINHSINYEFGLNGPYSEFFAYMSEILYKDNRTIITRSLKERIKTFLVKMYTRCNETENAIIARNIDYYHVGRFY